MLYTKIEEQFWADEKMLHISFRAKYLLMYLLTSPHRNILCFYFLPKPYACFDMGISSEDFDQAMDELVKSGRVLYDPETHVVCVKNYLKYNALDNANQVKSAVSKVEEVPGNCLFEAFAGHLKTLEKADSYRPLIEALYKRLGKPLPEPLPKPLPNTDNSKQIADSSKQENKRAKRAPARSISDPEVSRVFEKFSNAIHPVTGQLEADALLDLLDTYGIVWVEQAIGSAKGGKTVRYIAAILQRWKSTGLPEPWKQKPPSAGKGVLDIIDEMQGGGEILATGS